ncbi:hypothetical protein M378DRAFT_161520 [Amanita muscaria Koide BX008]|uniref:Uncharacterized protein n=1 Tax=Amanita muscaria (strain Koide BX008) TaxID=946122 RepID=A0A0C2WVS9_AMAMK|nr:hypothetical protein M378DRAFT_161520 [Amanita muscaria Koide BX008]
MIGTCIAAISRRYPHCWALTREVIDGSSHVRPVLMVIEHIDATNVRGVTTPRSSPRLQGRARASPSG